MSEPRRALRSERTDRPLCVKLNGALIRGDIFPEAVFQLLRQDPRTFYRLPRWLLGGKARLKEEVASRVHLDIATLPYNEPFVEFLRGEKAKGRSLLLVTGTNRRNAARIAGHLDLFDDVIASDGDSNVSPPEKRRRLVSLFGEHGFDYAGSTRADLPIWTSAHSAIAVAPTRSAERAARRSGNLTRVFPRTDVALRQILRVMRPHQWLKNILVFVPVVAGHQITDLGTLSRSFAAFVAFSLTASTAYVINDLFDASADRRHAVKRARPFASGQLSSAVAPLLVVTLLSGAALVTVFATPVEFAAVLVGYFTLTLAYSFKLKGAVLVDVVTLAALYTARVLAGSAATGIRTSVWLLAFSMFLFFSLALVKRYAELATLVEREPGEEKLTARSYLKGDLQLLQSMGTASGYVAVLVLALYIISDDVRLEYDYPFMIWGLCPLLLYWISRVWIVVVRGELTDDPLVWATGDQISRWVAVLAGIVIVLAA